MRGREKEVQEQTENDVLGAFLLNNNCCDGIINDLREEDFYFTRNKQIYKDILKNSTRIGTFWAGDLLPNKDILYLMVDCITANLKIKVLWLVEQSVSRRIGR